MVVPYTLRNNDILLIEGRNYSPDKFLDQIKLDFDQLYEEAATRRRMMSITGSAGLITFCDSGSVGPTVRPTTSQYSSRARRAFDSSIRRNGEGSSPCGGRSSR